MSEEVYSNSTFLGSDAHSVVTHRLVYQVISTLFCIVLIQNTWPSDRQTKTLNTTNFIRYLKVSDRNKYEEFPKLASTKVESARARPLIISAANHSANDYRDSTMTASLQQGQQLIHGYICQSHGINLPRSAAAVFCGGRRF